jgi:hypothetical protein
MKPGEPSVARDVVADRHHHHAADDRVFSAQRQEFALRFACEDCVYFVELTGACVHRYPNELHRRAAFDGEAEMGGTFCKEFESL